MRLGKLVAILQLNGIVCKRNFFFPYFILFVRIDSCLIILEMSDSEPNVRGYSAGGSQGVASYSDVVVTEGSGGKTAYLSGIVGKDQYLLVRTSLI